LEHLNKLVIEPNDVIRKNFTILFDVHILRMCNQAHIRKFGIAYLEILSTSSQWNSL
jgi:hypothetical protein